MVRRNKPSDLSSSKRPSQTLDLEAKEVDDQKIVAEGGAVADDVLLKSDDHADQSGNPAADEGEAAKMSDDSSKAVDETSDGSLDDQNEDEAAPAQPARRRGGGGGSFIKLIAAGVIGAVLVLIGQPFMPRLVGVAFQEDNEIDQLKGKILSLEEAVKADEIDGIKRQLAAFAEQLGAQRDNEIEPRLRKMEVILADLAKGAGRGDQGIEGLAALATKMNGIEAGLEKKLKNVEAKLSDQLREDVTKRSKSVAAQESLAQLEGVKLTSEEMGKRLAVIEARGSQYASKLAEMHQQIAGLKSELASKAELLREVETLQSKLSGFETNLQALKKIEHEAQETARASALALALTNLKRTMSRGEPYQADLEAVKGLMGPQSQLAGDFEVLSQFANEGLSRDQELMAEFPSLAQAAMLVKEGEGQAGLWDKVLQKARATFRYRRTGDVEGQTTEAITARMEHNFKAGQLEEVVELSKTLSPKAQQVVGPWVNKIKARLLVEAALIKIEDQLQAGLKPRAD